MTLLSKVIHQAMNAGPQICTHDSTVIMEELIQAAVGSGNDVRSRQAKEALRSEGFKDIEDMKSRIKCVGDLVGMGVPFPQAKAVWKVIHTAQNGKGSAECVSARTPPVSERELPVLPGVKMHKSLHEWSDPLSKLRLLYSLASVQPLRPYSLQARAAGATPSRCAVLMRPFTLPTVPLPLPSPLLAASRRTVRTASVMQIERASASHSTPRTQPARGPSR